MLCSITAVTFCHLQSAQNIIYQQMQSNCLLNKLQPLKIALSEIYKGSEQSNFKKKVYFNVYHNVFISRVFELTTGHMFFTDKPCISLKYTFELLLVSLA